MKHIVLYIKELSLHHKNKKKKTKKKKKKKKKNREMGGGRSPYLEGKNGATSITPIAWIICHLWIEKRKSA